MKLAKVALLPLGLVTPTGTAPGVPAGVVQSAWVLLITVTLRQAVPPMVKRDETTASAPTLVVGSGGRDEWTHADVIEAGIKRRRDCVRPKGEERQL